MDIELAILVDTPNIFVTDVRPRDSKHIALLLEAKRGQTRDGVSRHEPRTRSCRHSNAESGVRLEMTEGQRNVVHKIEYYQVNRLIKDEAANRCIIWSSCKVLKVQRSRQMDGAVYEPGLVSCLVMI